MNEIKLRIPNEILEYILYQRTELIVGSNLMLFRILNKMHIKLLYKTVIRLQAFIRRKTIKKAFGHMMFLEYQTIKDFLPINPTHVLDIGCGVGGIDIFIDKHYNSPKNLIFHLLDKTKKEDNIYYDYHEKGAFYNSLSLARALLLENSISLHRVHIYEVGDDAAINVKEKVDFVISLLSWGFHYPVDVYIKQVFNLLKKDGMLILDIRKNTKGEDKIREYGFRIKSLMEFQKYNRVIAIK